MQINVAIREANSRHEILFLLTAYVEAVGYCDEGKSLPWQVRDLPLAGAQDVKARIYGLHLRSRVMAPGSDDEAVGRIVSETLELYTTALRRLASLEVDETVDLAYAT